MSELLITTTILTYQCARYLPSPLKQGTLGRARKSKKSEGDSAETGNCELESVILSKWAKQEDSLMCEMCQRSTNTFLWAWIWQKFWLERPKFSEGATLAGIGRENPQRLWSGHPPRGRLKKIAGYKASHLMRPNKDWQESPNVWHMGRGKQP